MSAERHIELAEEYLNGARRACRHSDYRSASILATMAVEMAGRGLLISKGFTRPRSHGALSALIGREFVAKGQIAAEAGRKLHIIMEKRGRIFYEPTHEVDGEEASELISFTEEFVRESKRYIQKGKKTNRTHPAP